MAWKKIGNGCWAAPVGTPIPLPAAEAVIPEADARALCPPLAKALDKVTVIHVIEGDEHA